MTRRAVVLAVVVASVVVVDARGQTAPPEPSGYRMQDYRVATPATLAGARVVSTAEAAEMWKEGAAFVDVLPHAPRPSNLPEGTIWREKVRRNIPGSIWLPDTGYGALSEATEDYLRRGLDRITEGDHAKWLVIYCLRNCWMSWNAAKRVQSMGYEHVAWYPEGTDGWQEAGLPLQDAAPAGAE
ncbi:MAG: PQQ-dependent catabolism-associated CXXCW motif protein [Bradyrhizobiaceae bacterium]|nr:PQQ-dependent catabolism-associated CXXCW motif protein [Bradyrhizobiaceae bacterium]